ncbi:MAG: hypothetical protein QME60_08095 [Verrucomicrobiota bacterium]|nr:hypothetical protein [Verrucomicrobiota bacterium]
MRQIDEIYEVWCADITHIPLFAGYMFLVAIMDWFSRYVLAWEWGRAPKFEPLE